MIRGFFNKLGNSAEIIFGFQAKTENAFKEIGGFGLEIRITEVSSFLISMQTY